ncbi:hypothetical protein GGR57DRAFT_38515 [Xylariaceae sp. FL1272]|nr:hypothetical protein GGR57DRAFT_38515 [Xylariaceae sp. FL1272]
MSRYMRSPRLLSLARKSQSVQSAGPQAIRLQRVKFHKPFSAKKLIIAAGIYYLCYETYTSVILGKLDAAADALEAEAARLPPPKGSARAQSEDDDEGDDEDELAGDVELLYFPFPGTTKSHEPQPYRGSDPEWQTFVKISKDKPLKDSIMHSLAERCCYHPVIKGMQGVRWQWQALQISYPYKPPPIFTRWGLSIGTESIALVQHTVDPLVVTRMAKTLWPSAVAQSVWSFSSTLVTQNAMTMATLLGYDTKTNEQRAIENMQQAIKSQAGLSKSRLPPSMPSGPAGSALSALDKRATGGTTTPETPGAPASVRGADSSIPKAEEIYGLEKKHISSPMQAFKKTLQKTWRHAGTYPPRGAIFVGGLVSVETSRAFIIFDCRAWWDPKTKQFVDRAVSIQPRSVHPKTQAPLPE